METNPTALETDCFDKIFSKKITRSNYSQFTKHQKSTMKGFFDQNNYPNKDEFERLSKDINQPVNKIVNWFKHERRKFLTENSNSRYKKRKVFNLEEQAILKSYFKSNFRPTSKNYLELSQRLSCSKKQIKKWFSYRRIKLKKIKKPKRYSSSSPITNIFPRNGKDHINQASADVPDLLETSSKIKTEAIAPKLEFASNISPLVNPWSQFLLNDPATLVGLNDLKGLPINSNFLWNFPNQMGNSCFQNLLREANLCLLKPFLTTPARPLMGPLQWAAMQTALQMPTLNARVNGYLNQLALASNINTTLG